MHVQVKLYSIFRLQFPHYDAKQGIQMEMKEGSRIRDLFERLGIELGKLSMVRVNGQLERDHMLILADGDVIELFPMFGGG